ncbi:DUF6471 domain-containing protein [Duganella aquatilis]|uniref:DUF6471 domain-containing protein n=1 Tax=Duganella aquatilis TaxID=2666082 RepID=UPI002277305A|nr:DUF6471 domain-containing protein [Duganella aquatilis]
MRNYWEDEAKAMLRAEMARCKVSYRVLSMRLKEIGVDESEHQLRNKIARGKFAFSFFLQCMCAMGVVHILDMPRFDDALAEMKK